MTSHCPLIELFPPKAKVQDSAISCASVRRRPRHNLRDFELDLHRESGDIRERHGLFCAIHHGDHHLRRLGLSDHHPNASSVLREPQSSKEVHLVPTGVDSLQATTHTTRINYEAVR